VNTFFSKRLLVVLLNAIDVPARKISACLCGKGRGERLSITCFYLQEKSLVFIGERACLGQQGSCVLDAWKTFTGCRKSGSEQG
jgi:hypothetical protein